MLFLNLSYLLEEAGGSGGGGFSSFKLSIFKGSMAGVFDITAVFDLGRYNSYCFEAEGKC